MSGAMEDLRSNSGENAWRAPRPQKCDSVLTSRFCLLLVLAALAC